MECCETKFTKTLFFSAIVSALGGLLFGFDTAVIAGVIEPITKLYGLEEWGKGFTVSIALLGTMLGAATASLPAEKLGRRDSLIFTGALFFISAVGCAFAWDWYSLLFFRFIGGVGIGFSSGIAPMYIAEISPAKFRGVFVATFQWNIVAGILLAYLSNWLVSLYINCGEALLWRIKLGVEAIPALLFLIFLFYIPRSPYWLIKVDRLDDAKASLKKLAPNRVSELVLEIQNSIAQNANEGKSFLFQKKFFYPLFLAFSIALFNQFSGINAVLYYINDIFGKAGFDGNFSAVIVGAANFIFTVIAMTLIDKLGRKTLLLIGAVGTSAMLLAAALILKTSAMQGAMVYVLSTYIAFFAMSQGAVIWVYISEIFPVSVRAQGVSFGASMHWIFCFIISLIFPTLVALEGVDFGLADLKFNGSFPFFLFFAMTIIQLIVVLIFFPETKGRSLEEKL